MIRVKKVYFNESDSRLFRDINEWGIRPANPDLYVCLTGHEVEVVWESAEHTVVGKAFFDGSKFVSINTRIIFIK